MSSLDAAMDQSRSNYLPTRSSLLSRVQNPDDGEGWREFFGIYSRCIRGWATRSGLNPSEADDVVQETMVAVARQMPRFRYDRTAGSFKGWLFTITRRCVGRQLERRRWVPNGDRSPLSPVEPADCALDQIADPTMESLDAQWEQEWRRSIVALAMDRVRRRVNPKHFQMFDLYVTQQLPIEQIKKLLQVSAAQIYMAKLRVGPLVRREVERLQATLI
ncbi:MAG TPA: sigma-70 family RNA polymerase sigma factor [Methylomirabilota bacterium]|nr:sigma-70 family RNA polymerase sigma factor [Methylomirabilota bacterium]